MGDRRKKLLEVVAREWRAGDPNLPKDCIPCRQAGRLWYLREYLCEPQRPICFATKAECAWERKGSAQLSLDASDAWDLYQDCQTQWRTGAVGATGLDYKDVFDVAKLKHLTLTPRIFDLLRLIEAKRLVIWSDERKALEAKNKK